MQTIQSEVWYISGGKRVKGMTQQTASEYTFHVKHEASKSSTREYSFYLKILFILIYHQNTSTEGEYRTFIWVCITVRYVWFVSMPPSGSGSTLPHCRTNFHQLSASEMTCKTMFTFLLLFMLCVCITASCKS